MEVPLGFVQPRFLKRKDSVVGQGLPTLSTPSLEQLRSILTLPCSSRTDGQVSILAAFTRHLKFFSDIRISVSEQAHFQCCQYLTYAQFPPGKLVFCQGDEGSLFFIILAGSCAVLSSSKQGSNQLISVLRPGECFGELALISNMPSATSVLCREECQFAVLERDAYKKVLSSFQDRQLFEKLDLLKQHPNFGMWKSESVQRLSLLFKVRTLMKKQALFVAGQSASEIFMVKSGEFQLAKNVLSYSADKSRKPIRREVNVAIVRSGELLGAAQALGDTLFEFTCYCATSAGEVMAIGKKHFNNIVKTEGKVASLLSLEKEREQYWNKQASATLQTTEVRGSMPKISHEVYLKLLSKAVSVVVKPKRFKKPFRENVSRHLIRTGSVQDFKTKGDSLPGIQREESSMNSSMMRGKAGVHMSESLNDLRELANRRRPSGDYSMWKERLLHLVPAKREGLEIGKQSSTPCLAGRKKREALDGGK